VGNPGNRGRPPEEFKTLCQANASRGAEVAAQSVVDDPKHPAWLGAVKWATEHGYGKPEQPIAMKHSGKIIVEVRYTNDPGLSSLALTGVEVTAIGDGKEPP
jgi:hypothetical protein